MENVINVRANERKNEFGLVRCGNRRQKLKERIDIQGGLNQPASDRIQKAVLPRRGEQLFPQ